MPIIVIGADTPVGFAVIGSLESRAGEVRAFVTDPEAGLDLKARGIKVAIGDVSDGSHVAAAALGAFSAVFVTQCAVDERERSFTDRPQDLAMAWAEAVAEARVQRVIWLEHEALPEPAAVFEELVPEVAAIRTSGRTSADIAAEVARLDEAPSL